MELKNKVTSEGGKSTQALHAGVKHARPVESQFWPAPSTWTASEFARVVRKARRIGTANLSNTELIDFCRGAHGFFQRRYLIDGRPFFRELWKRIERHQIPGVRTKTQACAAIGCSLAWAEMIVGANAKGSNARKANIKRNKSQVNSHAADQENDKRLVDDICRYADQKLQSVMTHDRPLYDEISEQLEEKFLEAACGRKP